MRLRNLLKIQSFVFCSFAVLLLTFFNNCGEKASPTHVSSRELTSELPPGSDPNPSGNSIYNFSAGAVLSDGPLRSVSGSLADVLAAYQQSSDEKAMAVPQNKMGAVAVGSYVNGSNASQKQESLKAHVLNLCYLRYKSPCIVLAYGNAFAISGQTLSTFYNYSPFSDFNDAAFANADIETGQFLLSGQAISKSNAPFFRYNTIYDSAFDQPGRVAFAVSSSGRIMYMRSSSISQSEMDRIVMEHCQAESRSKCLTFVSGAKLSVSGGSSFTWTLPQYGDEFSVAEIPFISESSRASIQSSSFLTTIQSGKNGVIYLTSNGMAFGRASASKSLAELEQEAKQACEAAAAGRECYLYSKNLQVVWDVAENI